MRAAQQAAESLAAGLRAEKALWSEELATQGARLAQDRGRLEAKIEALAAERASLAKQLEACLCPAAAPCSLSFLSFGVGVAVYSMHILVTCSTSPTAFALKSKLSTIRQRRFAG